MRIRISPLDKLYSHWLRWIRDKGTCQRCFKVFTPPSSGLHCSHFHGRRKQSVRFDPENTAAMCMACHLYLGENPSRHVDFWLKRLGQARYDALQVRAETIGKPDYKMVELWLREEIKKADAGVIGAKQ